MSSVISKALIREALDEITEKTEQEIETETALRWGARAIAAYLQSTDPPDVSPRTPVDSFLLGEDFYHEAVEHAALALDGGKLVAKIQHQMEPFRSEARRNLYL